MHFVEKQANNQNIKRILKSCWFTSAGFFYFYRMKYLIAGLGNPGAEYELTRHNIGFLVIDRLADREGVTLSTGRYADKAEIKFKGRLITLIKPNTYMNLSGKAVNYWLQEQKVPKENLLVVTDDLALPFGKLRMRAKGSAAGHNGLTNIEQITGGQEYARLRCGIGSDFPKGGQVEYVLGKFPQQQMDELLPVLDKACDMIMGFCTAGIARTMSQFND